ncbi:MAG TPA: hypothetical protein VL689_21065 [Paraburkholderia sp.]|jgi:hypothetical protein|nr:hypothetical protein [Paraburkholderia sp.]
MAGFAAAGFAAAGFTNAGFTTSELTDCLAVDSWAGGVATFAARAGATCAAEAAWDLLRATGALAASDVFLAELATLAGMALLALVALLVGSGEPLPVAFFPPVVFAIAIPPLLETGLPGKTNRTAENLIF